MGVLKERALKMGESRSLGGETILLVEDEAFVRGVTGAVLEFSGYSVVAVGDAAEAQRIYEQHSGRIALLLTDIILPGEDGRCLARRLLKINSALQILLVTGYLEHMYVGEAQAAGGNLLQKPYTAATLLRTVRQLLDRRPRPGPRPGSRPTAIPAMRPEAATANDANQAGLR
jgi:two-component system, cell cycle sensor histidine kinase and response regulator CckA